MARHDKNKKKDKKRKDTEIKCPRCQTKWGKKEIAAKECDSCNFPYRRLSAEYEELDTMEFDENL